MIISHLIKNHYSINNNSSIVIVSKNSSFFYVHGDVCQVFQEVLSLTVLIKGITRDKEDQTTTAIHPVSEQRESE